MGGAELDGGGEVGAHAHRQLRKAIALGDLGAQREMRCRSFIDRRDAHQALNRQAERYARENVPIALSTMADAVGAVCDVLAPLRQLIEAHVMAAERLHGDDTVVPVLAKGKTDTGRCWFYVRDDRPFGGAGPPAE